MKPGKNESQTINNSIASKFDLMQEKEDFIFNMPEKGDDKIIVFESDREG
jgi:hypothetical protein